MSTPFTEPCKNCYGLGFLRRCLIHQHSARVCAVCKGAGQVVVPRDEQE